MWNLDEYCNLIFNSGRLRPLFLKMFDHWGDVLICLLINTSAPSHWLTSVAWPVGPVLKVRDIPDWWCETLLGSVIGLFTLETLKVSTVFTSSTPPYEFHLDNVNVNFVHNALKSLKSNKAVGLDKLSARLLKDASDVIAPILTGAINKSFTDGVFPGVWKCASHCII